MTEPVLRLEDITRYFGVGDARVQVLMGIDLLVEPGEFLAIMGPSGSGKSTLLNILGCLDRPTSGQYFLHGEDVAKLSDSRLSTIRNERIGFVFQSFNLIPQLTVLENVEVPLLYAADAKKGRARELLDRVGLSHRLKHRPTTLSGGERQRVAIARSLVCDPVMLLADEPTGNLDSKTGEEVLELMEELHRDGRTIVMITHDPEVSERAQRTLHLRDGLILEAASA
ncbi:MAG: ABC transporter ATP-binding protein [Planctomycetota bacterium]|nr:ABC transporter ATP-binding protein [Planctomycetota bacterium]